MLRASISAGVQKELARLSSSQQHFAGSDPSWINKSQMGMDYIHCIAQAVRWRNAASTYEHSRKMGLSYEAQSHRGFTWVPCMSLWPRKWGRGWLIDKPRAELFLKSARANTKQGEWQWLCWPAEGFAQNLLKMVPKPPGRDGHLHIASNEYKGGMQPTELQWTPNSFFLL